MNNKTSGKKNGVKLSIIIPIYNEEKTILEILEIVRTVDLPREITKREIILVDDCSTDDTREIVKNINLNDVKAFYHKKNTGKGGALNTGFKKAIGDIVIIQDADMEYDPKEYPKLLQPILDNKADVVYGSRYAGGESHRILYFWHTKMNQFLTLLSNAFSDLNLTDMETCYKVFRRDVLDKINIEENRFGFEPEITAKLGEMTRTSNLRIFEVGISYYGRTFDEGKKIGWKDGVHALWCIFKYNTSTFAHFVKYAMVGTVVAGTQFLVAITLIKYFSSDMVYLVNLTNFISIVVGLLVAFFLHSGITWRYKFSSALEVVRKMGIFFAVSTISVLARIVIFYFLNQVGIAYELNIAIGIVIMITINFFGYDKLVFNKLRVNKNVKNKSTL